MDLGSTILLSTIITIICYRVFVPTGLDGSCRVAVYCHIIMFKPDSLCLPVFVFEIQYLGADRH